MEIQPCANDSLTEAAIKILQQPDPFKKAEYTKAVARMWRSGEIQTVQPPTHAGSVLTAPDRPARADDKVKLVEPGQAPRLGKGGTLASRQAILHSLCHIESWAIDLSWDIIARFGIQPNVYPLPREFFDDFVTVAEDEARHFLLLEERLRQVGSYYGAIPAHDGLWESASTTARSLPARLAVEHCVHEARGLDVLPSTVAKFRNNGDGESARLLEGTIYPEEVTHCGAGVRWLKHLWTLARSHKQPEHQGALDSGSNEQANDAAWIEQAQRYPSVEEWFHALVRAHFHGNLKPPFNELARSQAGFERSWYMPLVSGNGAC